MSSRALAFLLFLGASALSASPAAAEPGRFAFLDAPPPAPPPLPPAPARESDEYPRRAWEGFPEVGFTLPFCRGDSFGLSRCADNGTGRALGAGALYRLNPYVGLGFQATFASFDLDVNGAASTFSRSSWIGFLARGYFLDRGAVEPYVETGIGRGSSSSGYADGASAISIDAWGPSVLAGAGVDFWIASFARIGPSVAYRWTLLTDGRACAGAVCETVRVADRGAVGSFASASFVATIAFGREM